MNVIPIITFKSSIYYACALITYTDIYTDTSDNIIYHIPLMAITNIMTGYTYIPVIVFLQVLLGLNHHL